MRNFSRILWGIVLIGIGLVIGLNTLEITNINIFFDGWWTLFIIIPCFIGLFDDDDKTGNLIGLCIGGALLLACQGIINFEIILKLIVPFILIVIGISLVFKETIHEKISEKVNENKGSLENVVATFADQKKAVEDEEFKGSNLDAVFGSIKLDLRKAEIKEDATIKASSIFGEINILVPNDVNIELKSTPIFASITNRTRKNKENTKTIYVDAFSMFGGINIK